MSFYSNTNVQTQPRAALDLGAIMRQVYAWVALGLVIAFGVAYFVGSQAQLAVATWSGVGRPNSILFQPAIIIISLIAYLVLAFTITPIIMRANTAIGALAYLLFTALFGFMIASIFVVYSDQTIALSFVSTAGMFAAMSIVGYTTKTDLSRFGSLLMMALIGLIIATIVNVFVQSSALFMIINYIGVLVFVALIAYDTQWIKNHAAEVANTTGDAVARIALVGAVHLFVDFMNLFLFILRILGGSSNRR
jgi:FtsH-binding integral membrane protein